MIQNYSVMTALKRFQMKNMKLFKFDIAKCAEGRYNKITNRQEHHKRKWRNHP